MANPWKKLWHNVNLSGKHGSKGANVKNNPKHRNTVGSQSTKTHEISITPEDLEEQFNKQNGCCYWLGIKLNPEDIFKVNYPLAMSVDRVDNNLGYLKDNIVICCRLINLGRRNCPEDQFKKVIEQVKEQILLEYNVKEV
jgi:hypothetical protein